MTQKSHDDMETTIHDEFFGLLTWEPLRECWGGQMSLPEGLGTVRVFVGTPDPGQDQTITPEARAAFTRVVAQRAGFARKAADDLLAVHNEGWHHHEDSPPLTSEQFQARLTLEDIHVTSWGFATAYYDDGDLFWGIRSLSSRKTTAAFVTKHISRANTDDSEAKGLNH